MVPSITLNSICAPSQDVVAREIEGEVIIIPLTAGIGDMEDELFTLNETGKQIWQRLDGIADLKQIATELATEYDAPVEEIERDTVGLIQELAQRKIITVQ
ncbi:PqqD family protein [candidate division KSB1 bacterium]|nr:PqqD family protein [candidate division KSB1 bacterium]